MKRKSIKQKLIKVDKEICRDVDCDNYSCNKCSIWKVVKVIKRELKKEIERELIKEMIVIKEKSK